MTNKNKPLDLIGFDNYRIFSKKTFVNLKPMTILTGPNSSGKSSVIKALKLLKQSCPKQKHGGLPIELKFIKDEYGHYLSSYDRIKSKLNKNNPNVSFILPINLESIGADYYAELMYGPCKNSSVQITLISFSVFKYRKGVNEELFKLTGELNQFSKIKINFSQFKDCLEKSFLPFFKHSSDYPFENNIKSLIQESKRSLLPGQDLINSFSDKLKDYDPDQPILPFYKVLEGVDYNYESDSETETIDDYYESLELVKKYFNDGISKSTSHRERGIKNPTLNYFKTKEDLLFEFIEKNSLEFPIDFASDDRHMNWWEGLTYNSLFDSKLSESNLTDSFSRFDKNYTILMFLFDSSFINNIKEHPNAYVLFSYIKYAVMQSIEEIRSLLTNISFFDSNRIEQTIFYHNSNARIAYNLLNDYNAIYLNSKESHSHISEQLRKLKIAESFEINATDYGIYQVHLVTSNKEKIPLAEFGFGITKLFFLLIALQTYPILFIEEPESNLHPDLQSKLADIMADSIGYGNQIVIESHSEYLIRKMQYLVATNLVEKESILINYFNSSDERKKLGTVRVINFRRDGSLDGEFGTGFFDEVANIIEDIYRYTFYN